jgi:hypothetical protein
MGYLRETSDKTSRTDNTILWPYEKYFVSNHWNSERRSVWHSDRCLTSKVTDLFIWITQRRVGSHWFARAMSCFYGKPMFIVDSTEPDNWTLPQDTSIQFTINFINMCLDTSHLCLCFWSCLFPTKYLVNLAFTLHLLHVSRIIFFFLLLWNGH